MAWGLLGLAIAYVSLAVGAVASARVVQATLPGDPLYALKIAYEAGHLTAAPSDFGRARLHLEYARVRLDEFSALVCSGRYANTAEAVGAYREHLEAGTHILDALVQDDPALGAQLGTYEVKTLSENAIRLTVLPAKGPEGVQDEIARAIA